MNRMCIDLPIEIGNTDAIALILLHVFLFSFSTIAFISDQIETLRKHRGSAQLTVKRGERSFGIIFGIYVSSLTTMLVVLESTNATDGHRVLLMSVDFALITYLLLFNSWFRNRVIFPLKNRISHD